jgi:hypothetical protein
MNSVADDFALQPEPIETLMVGIFEACADKERAFLQNLYDAGTNPADTSEARRRAMMALKSGDPIPK